MELTQILVEEERERAVERVTTEYLAFDAFEVGKVRCFLEGFEAFREMMAKAFLD